jgi:hypothetical protein
MNRKRTFYDDEMNAPTVPAKTNVLPLRRGEQEQTDEQHRRRYWPWVQRRLVDLGIGTYDMAELDAPTRPPGFYLNYTVALFYMALIGAVLGGFWFMYDRIDRNAYERGRQETELKQLQERLQKAEFDASEAKKFSVYAAAGSDAETGHKPQQQQKEQKKK